MSAWETEVLSISLPTNTDLSGSQYCGVTVDGNGNAVVPATGGPIVGVLQNAPTSGKVAAIRVLGVTKMVASAAITSGSLVAVTNAGKAKAVTAITANTGTGAITGSEAVGIALTSSANAGEQISVLLKGVGAIPGTLA